MLEDGVCQNDMVPIQVTECRISLGAVGGGSMQQSYSLLLEFKQIFESFPPPTDARHDDIREQASGSPVINKTKRSCCGRANPTLSLSAKPLMQLSSPVLFIQFRLPNCLWHRFYRNIELTQRKSGIVVGVLVFVAVAVKAFWVSILSAIAVLTINYFTPQVYFPDNNVWLPML